MAEELKVLLDAESNLGEVFTKDGIDAKALKTQLHGLAEDALGALIDFSKEGVAATLDLAEQQRDLARVTGTTAEEAGVMIQATDDMGISYGSLLTASKKLNAEGLSLNAENLQALRTEYSTITDPVERAQFATEKFGRAAGPEMQKALDLSDAAFQSFMKSAEDSALVLGDDAVQAARDYEIAQDNLNDAMQSAQVEIGTRLVPVLTTLTNFVANDAGPAIDGLFSIVAQGIGHFSGLNLILGDSAGKFDSVGGYVDAASTSLDQLSVITAYYISRVEVATGKTTEGEAATRLQALAHQDATLTTQQLTQATIDAGAGLDAHERAARAVATTTSDLNVVVGDNITLTQEQKDVYGFAESALRGYNGSESERLALENAIKIASGEMTIEELARQNAVINLTQALNDGKITQQQYLDGLNEIATDGEVTSLTLGNVGTAIQTTGGKAAEAADQVGGYNDNLGEVPDNVGTTITTTYVSVGTPPPIMNSEGVTSLGGGRASGGPVSAGVPYVVGEEGPEWFVPNSSGTIIPNSPSQSAGSMGGGGNTIYFTYAPMLSLGDRVELETVVKPLFERLGFVVK